MLSKSKQPRGRASRGFGDSIANFTKFFGIEPCGKCEQRKETLNRVFPYRNASALAEPADASIASPPGNPLVIPSRQQKPVWNANAFRLPENGGQVHLDVPNSQSLNSYELAYRMMERAASMGEAGLQPIYASTGGRRDPTAQSGPLDWEGQRRLDGAAQNQTQPTAGGTTPTTFACGVNVTRGMERSVNSAKKAFGSWNDADKNSACQALTNWSTGAFAWDIIELHSQVTSDSLNRAFRPRCATSGATPPCGSSVTVGGSCHFAGSANYVIFGVMCRLCNSFYADLLNQMSSNLHWAADFLSNHSPRDYARRNRDKFNENGMLYLIDLYKKYIPLATMDPVARNIRAAKRWSQAGFHGWPAGRGTPAGDRSNCTLTCTQAAVIPLRVSWYPHLNPYQRR